MMTTVSEQIKLKDIEKKIAKKIRYLRVDLDIRQAELAQKIGAGQNSVSDWERAKTLPRLDSILKMCEVFDVDLAYFDVE
jgi:transcriptional regulator with XRE-family HTH domain